MNMKRISELLLRRAADAIVGERLANQVDWRRRRGFREWRREPLRASLWRQKVDVVKGREPEDFGHVGQSVQRLEQILELSGWRDPEERPGRLVGLVEIAVWNPAWHAYQITGLGDAPHPIKVQRQLPFLHENKLALGRVNMDRDELSGIAVGFEREGAVADRFREIALAQDVPADSRKALSVPRKAPFQAPSSFSYRCQRGLRGPPTS